MIVCIIPKKERERERERDAMIYSCKLKFTLFTVKQLNEMGGNNKPSNSVKLSDHFLEKKKGFGDWMNLVKPGNEEKDHWVNIYSCFQHFMNLLRILMVLQSVCMLRPIYYILIPILFIYSFGIFHMV